MRTIFRRSLLIAGLLPLLASCLKDSEDLAQQAGLLPESCGSAGARLQATIGGSSYCASGHVQAVGDAHGVVVTGVSLAGVTLIVQLDSVALGTQAITEAANGILYMENGTAYTVLPGQSGALTITAADTAAHALKAGFSATLGNELSGQTRAIQGDLDVIWADSE